MTTYRILHVTYTDGRSAIVATEEDTAEGRRALEREAWRHMYLDTVESCSTQGGITRHTMRTGRGRK